MTKSPTVACVGVDLAWQSDKNHSAVAIGILKDGRLSVDTVSDGLTDLDGVVRCLDEVLQSPNVVVAIDAPLIMANESGARPCEREISRRFNRYHAGAHSSNLTLYPNPGSLRLVRSLEARGFTMTVAPAEAKGRRGRWMFEVYPHPAQVVLFDRSRIIKYKKPPSENQRVGLRTLAIETSDKLGAAEPSLSLTWTVGSLLGRDTEGLRGKARKHHEDRLDALFCVYLAAHYWYWGEERNEDDRRSRRGKHCGANEDLGRQTILDRVFNLLF